MVKIMANEILCFRTQATAAVAGGVRDRNATSTLTALLSDSSALSMVIKWLAGWIFETIVYFLFSFVLFLLRY